MIPYFESIGMEFGADLNAFTGFDQTAYMLFTPDTEKEQLDKALMVLSDYAFRALLLDEEIEKERGIVLEESRSGKNAFQRVRDKLWPELFKGSRFAQRLPIGDEEVISTAKRDEFVDYYRTWYRPENITVLMVGDTSVDNVTPLIEKWFATYKPEVPARKEMRSEFQPFTEDRGLVVTDPEMAICEVEMINIKPGRPPTITVDQFRTELVEYVGSWIVNRRLDERVKKGLASYRNANVFVNDFFNDAVITTGSATGEPEDWQRMLEEMVDEIHRARDFAFTERELALARTQILADAEEEARTEPTKNARAFLFAMLSSANDETPVLSAQQELDLYRELLPTIGLSEVAEAFKSHFTPGAFSYVVTMKEHESISVPSKDEVLAAAKAAWSRKVEPIKEEATPTELLAMQPKPGKIAESASDVDLGVTHAWLDNGVRVHHRYMDYKKDSVWISIALAGGEIEETAANAGITDVALLAFDEPATSRLSSTNIRDIMTGKNITVRGMNTGDAVAIQVMGSPIDVEIGLQAVHALLTDGKIEESAFKNWKLESLQRIAMFDSMPPMKAREAMEDLLSGSDPRRAMPTRESVERQSREQAQAWLDRLCREAPIEVAIVGDLSLEKAMPLMETYLGSLPARPRTAEHLSKLRKLARSTGPLARDIKVETVTPQAMSFAGFVATEGRNVTETRAMELASEILSSRLIKRIREELAIVYSIASRSNPSWIYEDAGRFMAGAPCDPANAARVADEVHKMYQEFAEKGPSEEELENAKKQVANNLDTTMREPSYWFGILRSLDLHGRDLNDQKTEKEAYQKFTVEQIQKVFRKYYTPERQFRVTAVPVPPPATDTGKEKSGTPAS